MPPQKKRLSRQFFGARPFGLVENGAQLRSSQQEGQDVAATMNDTNPHVNAVGGSALFKYIYVVDSCTPTHLTEFLKQRHTVM